MVCHAVLFDNKMKKKTYNTVGKVQNPMKKNLSKSQNRYPKHTCS